LTDAGSPRPEDPAGDPHGPAHRHDGSVAKLADYVYGTISTLVAIAGLTFEKKTPGALTTAGVVVVGAVAIWLAHAFSQLVITRPWQQLELRWTDLWVELRGSWTIVTAAIPATLVFILAGTGLWKVKTAFTLAEIVAVLALAVVGFGTAGLGTGLSWKRLSYVGGLVLVGVFIVLLELLVHLFARR
jgi:hypothetical protein